MARANDRRLEWENKDAEVSSAIITLQNGRADRLTGATILFGGGPRCFDALPPSEAEAANERYHRLMYGRRP